MVGIMLYSRLSVSQLTVGFNEMLAFDRYMDILTPRLRFFRMEFRLEQPILDHPIERNEDGIAPEIKRVLDRHIVDMRPNAEGNRELIKTMGNAPIGVREAFIDRPHPPMAIENVTLESGKGKVLIGQNGAGKSTLFDALMDRDAFLDTRAGTGAFTYGKPTHAKNSLRISRLDQEEIFKGIGTHTAQEVLHEASEYFKNQFTIDWEDPDATEENIKNQTVHNRIDAMMHQIISLFEMEEFMETDVEHLSGGERTKLALFMVLLSEPDVLLLDEPTNHLDLESISKLTALFNEYKKAGVAILSASHVNWFLEDAGRDGVVEIQWDEAGRVVKESNSPYEKYVKNPEREKTPIIDGEIEWLQPGYGYKNGETVIESPEQFSIPDSPLTNVSLPNMHGGDLIMVSGNNGTGKTKLMETIVHTKKDGLPKKQKGVQIAYLPQFWPQEVARGSLSSFFGWVKEQTSPHSRGSSMHDEQPPRQLFLKLARNLKFGGAMTFGEDWMKKPFHTFSGGEQRLLWFLAVSSMQNVDVLMLDEPTNHMDRSLQEKVTAAIQRFPGAVVLSTHDRTLISNLTDSGKAVQGIKRNPINLVFEKKKGITTIQNSKENPVEYMNARVEQARKQARKLKI